MKMLRLLPLITVAIGLLAVPARADKKHRKHPEQYYHNQRRSVTWGIGEPRRYSYGHSSSVIVERARPAYYERRIYDVLPTAI